MKKVTWSSHILRSDVLHAAEGGHSTGNSLRNFWSFRIAAARGEHTQDPRALRTVREAANVPFPFKRTAHMTNSWSSLNNMPA